MNTTNERKLHLLKNKLIAQNTIKFLTIVINEYITDDLRRKLRSLLPVYLKIRGLPKSKMTEKELNIYHKFLQVRYKLNQAAKKSRKV